MIQDDPKNAGSWLDSTATVSLQGSSGCESRAQASVTSDELSISYLTPEAVNYLCSLPLSSGGASTDVRNVGPAGNSTLNNGTFTINAGGIDMWDTSDAFHIVHQSFTGDGEIVARIASFTVPSGADSSLAAVTFREKLTANSIHASMIVTSKGKAKFRRRIVEGGTTLSDGPSEEPPRSRYGSR